MINADQTPGAYWIQLRGLGECGIRRVQQLAILRYARGPYEPSSERPTYDVGLPQGVVSKSCIYLLVRKDCKWKKVLKKVYVAVNSSNIFVQPRNVQSITL